ncbi:MAG: IMPACT family protein [Propionibacteriaceae bacterium]|nr:IMPACT family protein [Propionibacteriaceae bacterium]
MATRSTLAAPVTARIEVKKSIFIGQVIPVVDVAQANAALAAIRKEHYGARHHCSAMILGDDGELQRSNDDGEPAGSAGAPILAVLVHQNLTNVIAVVTRYFGGTLLGVGGLIRAYTSAVSGALTRATVVSYQPATAYLLSCDFEIQGDFESKLRMWLENHCAELTQASYEPHPQFELRVAESDEVDFATWVAPWRSKGVSSAALGAAKIAIS